MSATKEIPRAVVFGGSSGLGREIALLLGRTHTVRVLGRKEGFDFSKTPVHTSRYMRRVLGDAFGPSSARRHVETVVYAAGYFQEEKLGDMKEHDIRQMMNVGLVTPVTLVNTLAELSEHSEVVSNLVLIGSTSAFIPREKEVPYAAAKAGLTHFARSVSLDPRFRKVLMVQPSGMKTAFWSKKKTDRNLGEFLDPGWVAEQVVGELYHDFGYRELRILRGPKRVKRYDIEGKVVRKEVVG